MPLRGPYPRRKCYRTISEPSRRSRDESIAVVPTPEGNDETGSLSLMDLPPELRSMIWDYSVGEFEYMMVQQPQDEPMCNSCGLRDFWRELTGPMEPELPSTLGALQQVSHRVKSEVQDSAVRQCRWIFHGSLFLRFVYSAMERVRRPGEPVQRTIESMRQIVIVIEDFACYPHLESDGNRWFGYKMCSCGAVSELETFRARRLEYRILLSHGEEEYDPKKAREYLESFRRFFPVGLAPKADVVFQVYHYECYPPTNWKTGHRDIFRRKSTDGDIGEVFDHIVQSKSTAAKEMSKDEPADCTESAASNEGQVVSSANAA